MTSQPGKQILAIQVLPVISTCKGNQTMKFDQLIEYNMRNNFLEKSTTKCGGETIKIEYLTIRKSILSISWIESLKFHTICFYGMPS